jgi:hypothetical protein
VIFGGWHQKGRDGRFYRRAAAFFLVGVVWPWSFFLVGGLLGRNQAREEARGRETVTRTVFLRECQTCGRTYGWRAEDQAEPDWCPVCGNPVEKSLTNRAGPGTNGQERR